MKIKLLAALLAFALLLGLAGCDSEGPAEKADEKVDKAVESTKETVEEVGKDLNKAVKDLKD